MLRILLGTTQYSLACSLFLRQPLSSKPLRKGLCDCSQSASCHILLLHACRCFNNDLTVHKTIKPWSCFSKKWHVSLEGLQQIYLSTADDAGLVHAVQGPRLSESRNTYAVTLTPVGLQAGDAIPCNEEAAANAAHGLLHGLAALHRVRGLHP